MAHTNETANYHLSQFVGADIFNALTDYNGDMEKIDTAIKGVADASAGYASDIADLEIQNGSETLTTTAQTLSGAVNELDSETGDLNTRLTTAEGKITADEGTLATAVGNISTLAGKVSGLETKVGSAVLTTTASDCSGAINELDADISTLGGKVTALETQNGSEVLVTTAQTLSGAINELAGGTGAISASNVSFDGTTSSLVATNVQDAIDEVKADIPVIPSTYDADDIVYDNTTSGLVATDVQSAIDEVNNKTNNNYSATETVIGKWIDNKDIYRRVITASETFSDGANILIDATLTRSDVDTVIDAYGSIDIPGMAFVEPLANSTNGIAIDSAGVKVWQIGTAATGTGTVTAVIEYTKTV